SLLQGQDLVSVRACQRLAKILCVPRSASLDLHESGHRLHTAVYSALIQIGNEIKRQIMRAPVEETTLRRALCNLFFQVFVPLFAVTAKIAQGASAGLLMQDKKSSQPPEGIAQHPAANRIGVDVDALERLHDLLPLILFPEICAHGFTFRNVT